MVKILVCDDCIEDLKEITNIIYSCYKASECTIMPMKKPQDILDYFNNSGKADIIFLDIIMPEMSGIELARQLRQLGFDGQLIFLTVSNEFAAQSYEVEAFSYLLKPITAASLKPLINKIKAARSQEDTAGFRLTSRSGSRFILFSELMYVETFSHRLYFHLCDGEVIQIYSALKEYAATLLADARMMQCHRSYIVNMDYIISFENQSLLLKNGTRISVPKNFKELQEHCFEWMFSKKAQS